MKRSGHLFIFFSCLFLFVLSSCSGLGLSDDESKDYPQKELLYNFKLVRAEISLDNLTEEEKQDKETIDLAVAIIMGRYKKASLRLHKDSSYYFDLDKVSGAGAAYSGKWYITSDSLENQQFILELDKNVQDSVIELRIMGRNKDSLRGIFEDGADYVLKKVANER